MLTSPEISDRVRETSTTTGTGTFTLAGASPGFVSFATAFPAASTQVYYCIAMAAPGDWEVGIGTFTLSGTTLSRTTVLSSSNAGALVNFAAGTKDVFVTLPSSIAKQLISEDPVRNGTLDLNTLAGTRTSVRTLGGTNANAPANYGILFHANNIDVNTQLYMTYNDGMYYRGAASSTLAGAAWRAIVDSVNVDTHALKKVNGSAYRPSFASSVVSTVASTYSGLEIREAIFAGAQTGVVAESPRISFNWHTRVASQIAMNSSGDFLLLDAAGTSYEDIYTKDVVSAGTLSGLRVSAPLTNTTGTAAGGTSPLRLVNPDGGAFCSQTATVTGSLRITLPVTYTSTMVHLTIKIFEYNQVGGRGTSREISLGGFAYPSAWAQAFAYQITDGGADLNVRFGDDGAGKACVWIGDTATVWNYPQVFVQEAMISYNYAPPDVWRAGWTVSFQTSYNTVTNGPFVVGKQVTSQNFSSYNLWNSIGSRPITSDWSTKNPIVARSLSWMYYGNGHVIFDASQGLGPDGVTSLSSTDAAVPWVATYPLLVGWNGTSSYGVKVDRSRLAEGLAAGADKTRLDSAVTTTELGPISAVARWAMLGT